MIIAFQFLIRLVTFRIWDDEMIHVLLMRIHFSVTFLWSLYRISERNQEYVILSVQEQCNSCHFTLVLIIAHNVVGWNYTINEAAHWRLTSDTSDFCYSTWEHLLLLGFKPSTWASEGLNWSSTEAPLTTSVAAFSVSIHIFNYTQDV